MSVQPTQKEIDRDITRDTKEVSTTGQNQTPKVLDQNNQNMMMSMALFAQQQQMMSEMDDVEVYAPYLPDVPKPLFTFNCDEIPDFIKVVCNYMKFSSPTPIQKYSNFF